MFPHHEHLPCGWLPKTPELASLGQDEAPGRWVQVEKTTLKRVMPPTPSGQDHCCYRSVGASGSLRQNLIVISALKLDILERLACKHHCFLSKSVSQPGSMLEIEFLLLGWRLAQDACSRPDLRNRKQDKARGEKDRERELRDLRVHCAVIHVPTTWLLPESMC